MSVNGYFIWFLFRGIPDMSPNLNTYLPNMLIYAFLEIKVSDLEDSAVTEDDNEPDDDTLNEVPDAIPDELQRASLSGEISVK